MPKRIVIVRHGRTEFNEKEIIQGHLPVGLDAVGFKQARLLVKELKKKKFAAVISSDLIRAIQTASPIAKNLKLKIIATMLLRERDMGNLVGKKKSDSFNLLNINPKLQSHQIWSFEESEDMINKYEIEGNNFFFTRVKTFIDDVKQKYHNKDLLIISHGGTIRVMLYHLGFTNKKFLNDIQIKNCSILTLIKENQKYKLTIKHVV